MLRSGSWSATPSASAAAPLWEKVELRQRDGRACVTALQPLQKGEEAFREAPYAAVQLLASCAPACAQCLQPLGLVAAHAAAHASLAAPGGARRRRAAALAAALAPPASAEAALPPLGDQAPQPCEPKRCGVRGCSDAFCGEPCLAVARSGWHGLLCAGDCDDAHPLREFRRHAADNNERFLLAARCVATALAAARAAGGTRAAVEAAAAPLQALHSEGPWWDVCATATERISAVGGRGVAARADKQLAARRAALRHACEVSHQLLCDGLQRHRSIERVQYAPLLDLDFYARLLGALEVCVVPICVASPLTDYCASLCAAPRAEQAAALVVLQPLIEAASQRSGTRLDASGELVTDAPHPDNLSDEDEEPNAGGASAGGLLSCGLQPFSKAKPPRKQDEDFDIAPPMPYPCFGGAMCCVRERGSPELQPPTEPGLLAGWAADVAQVVSLALCAGGTVVTPAGGAAAAAQRAPCGVRWGDAPERVTMQVAQLAPELFDSIAGMAIAPLSSRLNHSCVPSCRVATVAGGCLAAATLHDVAADSELTIAYTPPNEPQRVRRDALAKHGFVCECARCTLEVAGGPTSVAAYEMPAAELRAMVRQALDERNFGTAEALLRCLMARATAMGAPDGEAAYALGLCLLSSGRYAEAHDTWAAGARESPGHATLAAQVAKAAFYWPAPGAAAQLLSARDAMVPSEDDWFAIPITPGNDAVATRSPLLAAEDCAHAVAAAEAAAAERGGWTSVRSYAAPTTDMPLHRVPGLLAWFNTALRLSLAPLLAATFPEIGAPSRLCVHDVLIVRYSSMQRSLPVHVDQSQYSLTIALNARAEYVGGGTYFEAPQLAVCPDVGHVVAFRGNTRHGAEPITAGVRYVLACFFFLSNDDSVSPIANDLEDRGF